MNDKELKEKLNSIRDKLNLFGINPHLNHLRDETREGFDPDKEETWTYTLSHNQATAIKELSKLFQSLNWQLALNEYKEIDISEREFISKGMREQGTPVKITPCAEKYGKKTYFGILLGDMARGINCSIDKEGTLKIAPSFYNPSIFVPELNEIIYGSASWWGKIEKEEDLEKLITQDTIDNVWYMKILKSMTLGDSK